MYFDKGDRLPYLHNHAVYYCKCNKLIDQCPCPSMDDKEVFKFDTCNHGGKKFVVDETGVFRPAMVGGPRPNPSSKAKKAQSKKKKASKATTSTKKKVVAKA